MSSWLMEALISPIMTEIEDHTSRQETATAEATMESLSRQNLPFIFLPMEALRSLSHSTDMATISVEGESVNLYYEFLQLLLPCWCSFPTLLSESTGDTLREILIVHHGLNQLPTASREHILELLENAVDELGYRKEQEIADHGRNKISCVQDHCLQHMVKLLSECYEVML